MKGGPCVLPHLEWEASGNSATLMQSSGIKERGCGPMSLTLFTSTPGGKYDFYPHCTNGGPGGEVHASITGQSGRLLALPLLTPSSDWASPSLTSPSEY